MEKELVVTEEQLSSVVTKGLDKFRTEITEQVESRLLELERKQAAAAVSNVVVKNDVNTEKRLVAKFFTHAVNKDNSAIEQMKKDYPTLFTKSAGDPFSEASNGAGLYSVPTAWASEVFANVEQYGFARKFATVMPQAAYKMNLTGGTSVSVSFPGMNTAPTMEDPASAFTQTVLTLNTLVGASAIQKDLINESAIDIIGHLTKQYALAIALAEDTQFFKGSGSPFTGAISATGANVVYQGGGSTSGKTAFSHISWTDLIKLRSSVNTVVQANAKVFVSQSVFDYIVAETAGSRPVFDQLQPTDITTASGLNQKGWTGLGMTFIVLPNAIMPTTSTSTVSAIYADFGLAGIIGVNKDMSVEVFDQYYGGKDLAGTRAVALAVSERISMGFPLGSAIGLLKTSAS